MNRTAVLLFACLPIALFVGPAAAATAADDPPHPKPWFVDDEKFFDDFMASLTDLAKDGKCLNKDTLATKMTSGQQAHIRLTKPGNKALTPPEVYKATLPSVFIIGSVYKDKEKCQADEWKDGTYATAWVAAADGVLVTNWHVFDDLREGEAFGAVDCQGTVYPVTDFLGGDKVADVAVVRIAAKGLKPLPVSDRFADIGSWVGVLGHPGDNYFVFTQGHVTRYSTNKNEDGKKERWMGLTAEYAGGSSGSPVLDKYGSVVGMAALTLTIDGGPGAPGTPNPGRRNRLTGEPPAKAPSPHEKPDPKEPPKPEQMPGAGPAVQMVLKMAVPGPIIHKLFAKMIED